MSKIDSIQIPLGDGKFRLITVPGVITNKFDGIKLKYYLIPNTIERDEFFKIIVRDRFEKKDRIFKVYSDFKQYKACVNLEQVLEYSKWASHFVPNTFYKWNYRGKENLRCIRWMVFDFELYKSDGTAFTPAEVFEIFGQTIGFYPTFVVRSKTTGHYHVYLEHTSVTGHTQSIGLWEKIQKKIQQIIGTDEGALGANHNFAIPKGNIGNIYYGKNNLIDFDDLKKWYIEQVKEEYKAFSKGNNDGEKVISFTEKMVWNSEPIQALMNAEFDGSRNRAGFTLALLFYAFGKDRREAVEFLFKVWYPRVNFGGKPYYQSELRASIRSAYSGKYNGPSREYIEALTGMDFPYKIYQSKYIRTEKHNKNDNVAAIINFFRERDGQFYGTKNELVQAIVDTQVSPLGKTFAFSSIERNLYKMKGKTVFWETSRGGNVKQKQIEFTLKDGIKHDSKTVIEYNNNLVIFDKEISISS